MSLRRLVIATRNPGKVKEIASLLADLPLEILSLADYPPTPEVEETGTTFAENAIIKAVHAANLTGELALADDSGLEVDALGGRPGIESSRFAGPGATDADRNRLLLDLLKDAPEEKRTSRFRCVVALARTSGEIETFEGTCEGRIALSPRGENGFGYDPIFLLPDGRMMAELEREEKNRISHRGKAIVSAKHSVEQMISR